MKHRIFIVDDHAITRKGYMTLFEAEPDLEVCGESASGLEALEQILATTPDVAIIDVMIEGMGGLELVKHVHAQQPNLPMLVVSMHDEMLYAERALRAGAQGYVMKNERVQEVITAVRRILHGGMYVSGPVSDKILRQFASGAFEGGDSPVARLSDRELEVFEHLGRGLKSSQIAEMMLISPRTVDSYRERLKAKLGFDSSQDLLQYARQHVEHERSTGTH